MKNQNINIKNMLAEWLDLEELREIEREAIELGVKEANKMLRQNPTKNAPQFILGETDGSALIGYWQNEATKFLKTGQAYNQFLDELNAYFLEVATQAYLKTYAIGHT